MESKNNQTQQETSLAVRTDSRSIDEKSLVVQEAQLRVREAQLALREAQIQLHEADMNTPAQRSIDQFVTVKPVDSFDAFLTQLDQKNKGQLNAMETEIETNYNQWAAHFELFKREFSGVSDLFADIAKRVTGWHVGVPLGWYGKDRYWYEYHYGIGYNSHNMRATVIHHRLNEYMGIREHSPGGYVFGITLVQAMGKKEWYHPKNVEKSLTVSIGIPQNFSFGKYYSEKGWDIDRTQICIGKEDELTRSPFGPNPTEDLTGLKATLKRYNPGSKIVLENSRTLLKQLFSHKLEFLVTGADLQKPIRHSVEIDYLYDHRLADVCKYLFAALNVCEQKPDLNQLIDEYTKKYEALTKESIPLALPAPDRGIAHGQLNIGRE